MFSVFFFAFIIKIRPISFLKHPRVVSCRVVYVVRAIGDGEKHRQPYYRRTTRE